MAYSANIIELLPQVVASYGERVALVQADRSISFTHLAHRVERCAAELEKRGVRQNDNVLVAVPMSIELYVVLLGVLRIGATAIFVDAWGRRARIERACTLVPIRAFVASPKGTLLRWISPLIRSIDIRIVVRPGAFATGDIPYSRIVDRMWEDPALITFTTGSTGAPRGGVRTHGFLQAQHASITHTLAVDGTGTDMPALPIFVLSNIAVGGTSLLPPIDPRNVGEFDPGRLAAVMRQHCVRSTTASPYLLERLAIWMLENRYELPDIDLVRIGGSAVNRRLATLLVKAFPNARVLVIYGSTEVEPISTIDARQIIEAPESEGLPAGRPASGVSVRIILPGKLPLGRATQSDLDCATLAPGNNRESYGEILVSGDHVLQKFISESDVSGEIGTEVDGTYWHPTGDGGYLDVDGNLYLLGRVSMNIPGSRGPIFPFQIEERLNQITGVTCGTAVPTLRGPVVVIEGKAPAKDLRDSVQQSLRDLFDSVPPIIVLRSLPRDPRHNSRIDYRALIAILERRRT